LTLPPAGGRRERWIWIAPLPGSGIPAVYLGTYAVGTQTYWVNRLLLASIHSRETRFSTARAVSLTMRRGTLSRSKGTPLAEAHEVKAQHRRIEARRHSLQDPAH
jgi:hypothetical protein